MISLAVGLEVVMGIYEAAFHLALGFIFFLVQEGPPFLANRGVWLALLFLPLLAFGAARVLGGRRAGRGAGTCTSRHLQALATILLALFVASLVISGAFGALKELTRHRVFASANGIEGYENRLIASELQKALQEVSETRDHFPDSLAELEAGLSKDWISATYRDPYAEELPELPMYLAAGAPTSLDPSFPVLISARHRSGGRKWHRTVFTMNGVEHHVEEPEISIWVQRALDARRAHSSP
ncbi:hypothetical protein OJ996_03245 [Luteolibacter sp. GHJ8]|uniref:Uncharacterized protein n=1 Tax=Luteolibacter rhizosphaerae TaxID=2989719 RepID=A0ABT3FYB7_9BACT|nr:hypothetical protein [Luteolibacter rhizosphaerae]MCW1912574.1 hypothetical protein [Luteolibacter rhizosphaerae]